jgi:hypothetical protein
MCTDHPLISTHHSARVCQCAQTDPNKTSSSLVRGRAEVQHCYNGPRSISHAGDIVPYHMVLKGRTTRIVTVLGLRSLVYCQHAEMCTLVHLTASHRLTVLRGFHFMPVFSCSFQITAFRVHMSQVLSRFSDSLVYSAFNSSGNVTTATKVHGVLATHPCEHRFFPPISSR